MPNLPGEYEANMSREEERDVPSTTLKRLVKWAIVVRNKGLSYHRTTTTVKRTQVIHKQKALT